MSGDASFGYIPLQPTDENAPKWAKFRATMARIIAEDPEDCECPVCVRNWEEHG